MEFLLWIIIGGIAGWVATLIMKTRESIVINIILGIVGGLLGGWILGLLGMPPQNMGLFASFVTAVVGACILIALGRLITGNRAKV
ncbi:MAG TPA: GlsB/YeaQ/YmgE family stress response membrane protein [Propionibacteriaceae bacterium]|nr:GlsB/YeaQ/YmgE family stress response membrane protein [Propionibacteriaceae bacterium]HPZ50163.1 GlsB/YeaQ/YmgE family stress response membrane protein [Propionibacteriaceae bacterium]